MSRWRRDPFRPTYIGAAVVPGDHGIGASFDDKRRIGLLEVTDRLRWVPEEGEGWSVPIRDIEVVSPVRGWRDRAEGIVLLLRAGETVSVFGRTDGGVFGSMTTAGGVSSPALTADVRRELLARGAADVSRPRRTEAGEAP